MRFQRAVLFVLLFQIYLEQADTKSSHIALDDEDMLLFWKRINVAKCKPFTVFKMDCNHCVCAADGTSSCTRMDCRPRATVKKLKRRLRKPPKEYYTEETDESE